MDFNCAFGNTSDDSFAKLHSSMPDSPSSNPDGSTTIGIYANNKLLGCSEVIEHNSAAGFVSEHFDVYSAIAIIHHLLTVHP